MVIDYLKRQAGEFSKGMSRAWKKFYNSVFPGHKSLLYRALERTREARYLDAQMRRIARSHGYDQRKIKETQEKLEMLRSSYDSLEGELTRLKSNQQDTITESRLIELVKLQKHGLAQKRRENLHLKASMRREMNQAISDYVELCPSKDCILVVNHAGFITAQSPSAKKITDGNLRGKNIYNLISGAQKEREIVLDHFDKGDQGWVKVNRGEKVVPAYVLSKPLFYNTPDGKEQHSTILTIKSAGWSIRNVGRILSGERCLQSKLVKEADKSRKVQELAKTINESKSELA